MAQVNALTKILNALLLSVLLISAFGFLTFANSYGFFLAAVTLVISVGVFKYNRWAYFASAAWALACYQLAKQGYEFESIKRWVMIIGFAVIGLSIYLHERLSKKAAHNQEKTREEG